MEKQKPSVLNYSNYREFLRDIYAFQKEANKNFSHRFIAQQVGATSSGWFADIINGRISLTGRLMEKLTQLIHLNSNEREYFELLVRYDQAGSLDEKNGVVKKMTSCKGVDASIVSKDQFEFYSTWYISAIRELLFKYDFAGDYNELGKKMSPTITAAQAKKAITILAKLKFIEKNRDGFLKPVTTVIKKDPSFKSVHWANFMKANITLAIDALEKYDKDERDISAVTIGLSEKGLVLVKEEIAALRKKLLAISESDPSQDLIYNCTIQLFPLTKKSKGRV